MNRTDQAPEPSMEEILASIRLIISDDAKKAPPEKDERPRRPLPSRPEPTSLNALPEEDVLDLTDAHRRTARCRCSSIQRKFARWEGLPRCPRSRLQRIRPRFRCKRMPLLRRRRFRRRLRRSLTCRNLPPSPVTMFRGRRHPGRVRLGRGGSFPVRLRLSGRLSRDTRRRRLPGRRKGIGLRTFKWQFRSADLFR